MNIKLTCPTCGQHYKVDIEPGQTYEDLDCQNCGGKSPVSAVSFAPSVVPPAPKKQTLPPRVPEYPSSSSIPSTPATFAQEPDENNVRLQCPSCKQVFSPLFDLKKHVGDSKCPNCGFVLHAPLTQFLMKQKQNVSHTSSARPSYNNAKANFFYGLSVFFFILGNIVAFVDGGKYIGFSAYCGGATIIFLLNAIYFKISAK